MPRKDSRLHHQPIDGTVLYIGSVLSTTYITCTAELCWSDTHGRNSRLLAKSGCWQGICITLLWFFTDDILLHIESVMIVHNGVFVFCWRLLVALRWRRSECNASRE
ncbi:unnamed protein product [Cercospora beticola]|nr:unnamed protein product [Cercospora beticola]